MSSSSAGPLERAVSLAALLVAVCAVAVSAYELKMNREQQRNSVWPFVLQSNSFSEGRFRRLVWNAGLGPALVRSFQVRVDGKPQRSWVEVLRSLAGSLSDPGLTYSTLRRGMVLVPNAPLEILVLPKGPTALKVFAAAGRLSTRVCYCSLYEECWVADSAADGDEPVKAVRCEQDAAAEMAQ